MHHGADTVQNSGIETAQIAKMLRRQGTLGLAIKGGQTMGKKTAVIAVQAIIAIAPVQILRQDRSDVSHIAGDQNIFHASDPFRTAKFIMAQPLFIALNGPHVAA